MYVKYTYGICRIVQKYFGKYCNIVAIAFKSTYMHGRTSTCVLKNQSTRSQRTQDLQLLWASYWWDTPPLSRLLSSSANFDSSSDRVRPGPLAPLAPFPKTFSRGNAPVATNACMLQQPAPESTMNQANWPGHRLKISEHWEKQCQTTWQKETFTTIIWGICVLPLRRYALYSPFLTEPGWDCASLSCTPLTRCNKDCFVSRLHVRYIYRTNICGWCINYRMALSKIHIILLRHM